MSHRKLGPRDIFPIAKKSVSDFIDDNAMSLAAGVAFYAALSLAPLLLLMLSVTSLLGQDMQNNLIAELSRLLGPQVGDTIQGIVESADDKPSAGVLSSIISIVTLLVSATGVFAELQTSMNHIWDVESKPNQGIKPLLRARLMSLGVVVSLGFLLLISMVASAALSTFVNLLGRGDEITVLWRIADIALSLLLFGAMFAVMFKLLPDVKMRWRNVVGGALVTAGLFVIGKVVIGLYIGHSTVASSYGAAGSLIAMLVWVYYSAVIVFLGAEVTQAWAERRGEAIEPSARARRIAHHPEEEKGAPSTAIAEDGMKPVGDAAKTSGGVRAKPETRPVRQLPAHALSRKVDAPPAPGPAKSDVKPLVAMAGGFGAAFAVGWWRGRKKTTPTAQ